MDIIQEYAPRLMDKSEIRRHIITLTESKGIDMTKQNKGQVMKEIMPFFKGKADGKLVNQVVSGMLV